MSTNTPTIRDTIQGELEAQGLGHYLTHATPVVGQLVAREQGISERLLMAAEDMGMDVEQVKDALRDAGLEVTPDPEPEPEFDDLSEDEETAESKLVGLVSSLSSQVERLVEFARRNGYSG